MIYSENVEATVSARGALDKFACWGGAVTLSVGMLVFIRWLLSFPFLIGSVPGAAMMKANAALCFILCGAVISMRQMLSGQHAWIMRSCLILVGGIASLTLLEYASGWNFCIDELLVRDSSSLTNTSHPGRMSPNAALCFVLMAGGLWLTISSRASVFRPLIIRWLGMLVVVIGLFAMLGYITGFTLGYQWWTFTGMAILSALLFILLGFVLLAFAWSEVGRPWLIERWVSTGFASGLALLVVVTASSLRSTKNLVDAANLVEKTHETLTKIYFLRNSINENQSSLCGFLITGNEHFLAITEAAAAQALRQVRELSADNLDLQQGFVILENSMDARWQNVDQIIEQRRRVGFNEAAARIASGTGEQAMAEIRQQLRVMEAEQQRLLKERVARSKAITEQTIAMLPLGTGLSLLFLGLGLLRLNRETAARQDTADALAHSRQRLEMALDAAGIGEWFFDPVTRRASRSLKHDQIFGYSEIQQQWNYELFLQHVHPADRMRVDQVFQESLKVSGDWAFECRISRHDGTQGWIWVCGVAVKGTDGRVLEQFGMVRDITGRKQAEEKLQDSEKRLRLAIDAAQMGSWDWDLLTGEILWTRQQEILFGYHAGNPSRTYADFINRLDPEDVVRVEAKIQQSIEQRTDFKCEFRVLWPDDSSHWLSALGRFHYDAGGRAVRMLGMVEEISSRKQAEQENLLLNAELELRVAQRTHELQTSNASLIDFKAALDEHALVTITDPEGTITYANDKFCLISRYSRQELLGQNHRIVNSGFHPAAMMGELWQTIVSGQVWHGELKNRAKDGSCHWVDTTIVPFFDESGKATQFMAICTEISARKQAEAALELSDFCVRQASMATFWVAPDARILRVNSAVCHLLGYTMAELLTMTITDLDPDFPVERWPLHWQELRTRKRMSFETTQKHKDGRIIPIEVDLNWLEFEGQEYNFAFVRDMTARKAAEKEISQLNADLESRAARLEIAVTELDAFSYSVAHDLRAPLRAVDGFSQLILKEQAGRLDDDGRRMLGAIRNESQRMGQLIDDLLAFSRLGRQQIEPRSIDMQAMVLEVFEELAAREPARKLLLNLQTLPAAYGTPEMIRLVWVNLISNAIKFTSGCKVSEIEIEAHAGADGLPVYQVKDHGVGFDMRYVAKLFGVFHRLHSQQDFSGTGVGLALVQRIIHRHGGHIWAFAEVKRGATFYFTLPNRSS